MPVTSLCKLPNTLTSPLQQVQEKNKGNVDRYLLILPPGALKGA